MIRTSPARSSTTLGLFSFTGLAAGEYVVRLKLSADWKQTFPANNAGQVVQVNGDSTKSVPDFGLVGNGAVPSLSADGVLHAIGSPGWDGISLDASGDVLTVTVDGRTQMFPLADVKSIDVQGMDRNDIITLTGPVPGGTITCATDTDADRVEVHGGVTLTPLSIDIGNGINSNIRIWAAPSQSIDVSSSMNNGSVSLHGTPGADVMGIANGTMFGPGITVITHGPYMTIVGEGGDDTLSSDMSGTSDRLMATGSGNPTFTINAKAGKYVRVDGGNGQNTITFNAAADGATGGRAFFSAARREQLH